MEALPPRQEVGSLEKPSWLVVAPNRRRATEAEVRQASDWGQRVGVEGHEELVEVLRKEELACCKEELRDWAALYAIRLLEAAGLDPVYDGEQRRAEMCEDPIRRSRGSEFLDHVQSFDNKYYERPPAWTGSSSGSPTTWTSSSS